MKEIAKKIKREVYCPKCNWEGMMKEGISKHFGEYLGAGSPENWGWEEWDDLVCPNCETVLEYEDYE